MKLITNIKDYYDGAIQYSDDVILRRQNVVETHELVDGKYMAFAGNLSVGFCGKIYPIYMMRCGIDGDIPLHISIPSDVNKLIARKEEIEARISRRDWGTEEYHEKLRINEFLLAAGIKDLPKNTKREDWSVRDSIGPFIEMGVFSFVLYRSASEYFDKYVSGKTERILGTNLRAGDVARVKSRYHDWNDSRWVLIKNPILADFGMQKLFDPYTAMQEIEMFLGRLSINETPQMPVGSDKVIAESKGFDEWSFRKMPTKKKS